MRPQLAEAPGYEACFLTMSANPQGQQMGKSPQPFLQRLSQSRLLLPWSAHPGPGIRKPGAETANQRGCHPENKFQLPAESKFEQKMESPKQIRNVCRQALQGKLSEASLVSSSLPIIVRSLSCRHSIKGEFKRNLGSPFSGDIELKNVDDDTFFKLIMWICTSSIFTWCSLTNAPVKNMFA